MGVDGLKPKEPCWHWAKSGKCNKLGCRRLHLSHAEGKVLRAWGRLHADTSAAIRDQCRHAATKKYEIGNNDGADTVSQSVLEMHL